MWKFILKTSVLCVFCLTFFLSNLNASITQTLYRDQVAVLMYHHIHDTDKSGPTITTKLFRDQLSFLRSQGYHFISLVEFKQFLAGAPVPDNAVLVTFDDGYESFYTNAYPILKQMNVPAVNFIITETLDHPQDGNVPFLSREEIRRISTDSNLVDFQCHTHALHGKIKGSGKALLVGRIQNDGVPETDDQYADRITSDTKTCIASLESITYKKVDSLAYPLGVFNNTSSSLVQEGGIDYAFTIFPKMAVRGYNQLRIPRINAGSPYISPESLHNMIMRRVTLTPRSSDHAALRETVEQIGGELTSDPHDGSPIIVYNGQQWRYQLNSRNITRNGQKIATLSQPIVLVGGKAYILLADLENLLNVKIYSDPIDHTFTASPPDSSETDSENQSRKGP